MKKGDIRKQEILDTAEMFFCKKGYEQTSIQDILDYLKTSKGSFYHHYTSKEAVLEGICRKRAEQIFTAAGEKAETESVTIRKLDRMMSGMIPFRDEKLSFLLMILHIFLLPEGRSVRESYCDALKEQFQSATEELIEAGNRSGNLFCAEPAILADICLSLVNRLWVRICEIMIRAEQSGEAADLHEMLVLTDQYRTMIEKGLSLPYGSLELIDLTALRYLNDQIHAHWNE